MRLPIQMKQHANLPTIGSNRQSDANESSQPNAIPASLHVGTSSKIGWRVAWPVRAVLHYARSDAMQNPTKGRHTPTPGLIQIDGHDRFHLDL